MIGGSVDHVLSANSSGLSSETDESVRSVGPTLAPEDGVWRTVAASAGLPDGGVQAFDVGTVIGFIERDGQTLRAVSGVCTHLGCRLAYEPGPRELVCPCHRAAFALTGKLERHELTVAPKPLPNLHARELDGVVQVYAPASP